MIAKLEFLFRESCSFGPAWTDDYDGRGWPRRLRYTHYLHAVLTYLKTLLVGPHCSMSTV